MSHSLGLADMKFPTLIWKCSFIKSCILHVAHHKLEPKDLGLKTMMDACCAESKITSEAGPTAQLQWNLLTVGLYLTAA